MAALLTVAYTATMAQQGELECPIKVVLNLQV